MTYDEIINLVEKGKSYYFKINGRDPDYRAGLLEAKVISIDHITNLTLYIKSNSSPLGETTNWIQNYAIDCILPKEGLLNLINGDILPMKEKTK